LENIKGIHIAIILSVILHGAFLLELGGLASAGKRPMAQSSQVIYVQANVATMNEPVQPETEYQPEPQYEPEPFVRPDNTSESEPPEQNSKTQLHDHPARRATSACQHRFSY
jgi:hypothetical protein